MRSGRRALISSSFLHSANHGLGICGKPCSEQMQHLTLSAACAVYTITENFHWEELSPQVASQANAPSSSFILKAVWAVLSWQGWTRPAGPAHLNAGRREYSPGRVAFSLASTTHHFSQSSLDFSMSFDRFAKPCDADIRIALLPHVMLSMT